jgi:hypothetical protein
VQAGSGFDKSCGLWYTIPYSKVMEARPGLMCPLGEGSG